MVGSIENINMVEFVKNLKHASDLIKMESPDYILAPVIGAVPLVDMLSVVDRKFPLDMVEYLPNSSRFTNRDELMSKWYKHFYEEHESGNPIKLVCLDEVLSGSSAVKGYRQFQKSIQDRAMEKAKELRGQDVTPGDVEKYQRQLKKKVNYKIVGFGEQGHNRNPAFKKLVNSKLVHLVDFSDIPTIDDVAYNTIRLVRGEQRLGRDTYLPQVEEFVVTPQYIDFLQNIANCVGADPSKVQPVNLEKIRQGLARSTAD